MRCALHLLVTALTLECKLATRMLLDTCGCIFEALKHKDIEDTIHIACAYEQHDTKGI